MTDVSSAPSVVPVPRARGSTVPSAYRKRAAATAAAGRGSAAARPKKQEPSSFPKESHSGLRIKDRAVTAESLELKLRSRKVIRLSHLARQIRRDNGDIQGDWVTIGVLANKGKTKQGKNGKNYAVWEISDLDRASVSLFLFDEAHALHWKALEGSIMAILNPSVREGSKSSGNSKPSMSLDHGGKLLCLGFCPDYGVCKATRADGASCTMPINLSLG